MTPSIIKRPLTTDPATSAKKRKVEGEIRSNRLAKLSQNVPLSSFEKELGNLTQEITDLKKGNAEKDQKWARPDLDPSWDPQTDSLLFQQIDIEEGSLNNKPTIRLFGVTEVIFPSFRGVGMLMASRMATLYFCTSPTSCITSTSPHRSVSRENT